MKKNLPVFLSVLFCLAAVACGKISPPQETATTPNTTAVTVASTTEASLPAFDEALYEEKVEQRLRNLYTRVSSDMEIEVIICLIGLDDAAYERTVEEHWLAYQALRADEEITQETLYAMHVDENTSDKNAYAQIKSTVKRILFRHIRDALCEACVLPDDAILVSDADAKRLYAVINGEQLRALSQSALVTEIRLYNGEYKTTY